MPVLIHTWSRSYFMPARLTQEEFINRSSRTHSWRYDYSKVNYISYDDKVIIICKEHGEFLQTPDKHLRGGGCMKCAIEYRASLKNLGQQRFLEKARSVHGDKYGYEKSMYISAKDKIEIVCRNHGSFFQIADTHLSGAGCQKCTLEMLHSEKQKCTEEYIEDAKKVHKDIYDYSQTIYVNSKSKVDIICKKHGKFSKIATSHLMGEGCPICKTSKGESKIYSFLSNINIKYITQHKFKECRYIRQLKFDFYLPEYNICIEYDGIQHYKPVDVFGGEEDHKKVLMYDSIKTKYCQENNIKLIRIKYTEFDKIEEILSRELKLI